MNDGLQLGYTPQQRRLFSKYAWRCLIMFSLLYMTLYCCRLNLGNAAGAIMDDMGWETKDIGILTSSLFWAYGIGQLVNGRLSEIVGIGRFIVIAALLSPPSSPAGGRAEGTVSPPALPTPFPASDRPWG